jgi:hypothetical protein
MRLALTKLMALVLVCEAIVAVFFAFMYFSYSYLSSSFTPLERLLIIALFLATAACCFTAALVLFNGWHLGAHIRSQWWRLSLVVAAGFNLAALAFDVRELAKGGWSSGETVGFYAEFATLVAVAGSLSFLALRPDGQARINPSN